MTADPIRVLHVDDDPDFRAVTADFFDRADEGISIRTEASAEAALDHVRSGDVDCVVSDYKMPGMDGLEFLEDVRDGRPDLPFVLFTGEGSERIASDALTAGATEYVRKGDGIDQFNLLGNRIRNAVEGERARDRLSELKRIRETVADINQALVRASTRTAVEARVCEILGDVEVVRLAAISVADPVAGRLVRRASAGDGAEFLEAIEPLDGDADRPRTPYERAVADGQVAVTRDVQSDPSFAPWHDAAADAGLHALAVTPLAFEGDTYGLLSLFGGRPRRIDDAIRDLLAELGDDIAHALAAIESRRRLEESEARFRTLADALSVGIITIDENSRIKYANPATETVFGYPPAELDDVLLTTLMPERLRADHREGIDRYFLTGERSMEWVGIEFTGLHRDGTEIPLTVSFGAFERDGEPRFAGVIRDVTDRRERQEELRRRNDYLDEFAGIVAHDLRNPMSIARARLDLAQRDAEDDEHLAVAVEMLDRMRALIDDLLTLARQGQTVEETAPVDLHAVLDEVRKFVGEDVTVTADPSLGTVIAHRIRLLTALRNLVRNAVEHGGDAVTISVEPIDDGFAVEDDGPGIPPDDRESVFEPGYSTKDDGTGFGLNIVRKVVESHGWAIVATAGGMGGARFEVTGVDRPE